ncbi:MAG TPA: cyclic nucleotide-binding and patatin-like phospholipase domain-containing protein [Aliidongia sp.]|uniref:cyclic nucleotide-binding and patatin-like phospholipase domain-containing protein n=1 Tax=Aliidongia sp. TaxID=1914230 RepID=UPI002DDC9B84|nr:cyclic nucleotide-binding and patatin-like phospholipase domain-containing protein [Aliidongia sp.]HEV2678758.1 cyclic nucleotide-binding and patatin-like phospholipase domain-containing protein [Aliidongia sp.]
MTEGMEDGFFDVIVSSLETQVIAADGTLVTQSDTTDSLWIVESGQLQAHGGLTDQEIDLDTFGPGQLVSVSLLPAAGPSLMTVTAITETVLWRLSLAQANALRQSWPAEMSAIWDRAVARATFLSLVLGLRQSILFSDLTLETANQLARMAEQIMLRGGEVLFRQGDVSDAIYVVINGRLDVVKKGPDGKAELVNEMGPGESVGELGLMTDQRRSADIIARRDTTVARLDKREYLEILRRDPEGITRGLVRAAQGVSTGMARFRRQHGGNLPSLALIAATPGMPLRESANALSDALGRRGSIILLTSNICTEAGYAVNDQSGDAPERNFALLRWLNDLERHFSCILYVADEHDSPWTQLCARQADHVLMMIDGSARPEIGPVERVVRQVATTAEQRWTTLLLQSPNITVPSGTINHLALRPGHQHMHVRAGSAADWARVARSLTGNSVGVVFGGGGARGFAHIGIIRALEEHGIPVDVVGGTSVGALVAGQYALGRGPDEILEGVMSLVKTGEQFTLPLVSLMSGRRFSRGLHDLMGDGAIEDSWRKFFCISCNLTSAQSVVHSSGSLWKAVLASNSPPGLLPPVIRGGDLLVDGGLLDGLPTETMNKLNGKGLLIVINVTPKAGVSTSYSYDYGLSGWRILWNRLNPWANSVGMPNIVEILTRSMAIGSIANRAQNLKRTTDLLLEPELKDYSVTDHVKGRAIAEFGYTDSIGRVAKWWDNQLKL